jgi:hypothetical protein
MSNTIGRRHLHGLATPDTQDVVLRASGDAASRADAKIRIDHRME